MKYLWKLCFLIVIYHPLPPLPLAPDHSLKIEKLKTKDWEIIFPPLAPHPLAADHSLKIEIEKILKNYFFLH